MNFFQASLDLLAEKYFFLNRLPNHQLSRLVGKLRKSLSINKIKYQFPNIYEPRGFTCVEVYFWAKILNSSRNLPVLILVEIFNKINLIIVSISVLNKTPKDTHYGKENLGDILSKNSSVDFPLKIDFPADLEHYIFLINKKRSQ